VVDDGAGDARLHPLEGTVGRPDEGVVVGRAEAVVDSNLDEKHDDVDAGDNNNECAEDPPRPENVECIANASVKTGTARKEASDSSFCRLFRHNIYDIVSEVDLDPLVCTIFQISGKRGYVREFFRRLGRLGRRHLVLLWNAHIWSWGCKNQFART